MAKKMLRGKVVSDINKDTVNVEVVAVMAHKMYGKRINTHKKYKAHDTSGANVGDEVVIQETRPISKRKTWEVIQNLSKEIK